MNKIKIEKSRELLDAYEKKENLMNRLIVVDNCFNKNNNSNTRRVEIKATGISDTTMYMLSGNSITVNVLEAIFEELLLTKYD